jgi:hypothetical protein
MDKIINVLLLVIIFVFDPLAISLVIAANFAFAQINPIELPKIEEQIEPEPKPEPLQEESKPEFEEVGEKEYNPLDLNQDGVVDKDEILRVKQKILELENMLQTQSLSSWRIKKLQSEIDFLKYQIRTEEEETKTY